MAALTTSTPSNTPSIAARSAVRPSTTPAVDFTSVRNANERAVCDAVAADAARYPGLASAELLADVACVALNRLQPRYIRHEVDFAFYVTEKERALMERRVAEAVEYAFGFVQARTAMRARG